MTVVSAADRLLMMSAQPAAWACTVCDSASGQRLRDGIFNDSFWLTLAAVVAPFPVLFLALAAYHFGVPQFAKRAPIAPQRTGDHGR